MQGFTRIRDIVRGKQDYYARVNKTIMQGRGDKERYLLSGAICDLSRAPAEEILW